MNSQQLRLIAVALAVLLLLWGGSELLSRGSDTVTGSFALPKLSQADVDTVTIIKGTDTVVLAKQSSGTWSVNGQRAAADAIGELFQAFTDTTRPELVAQAAASFARLGVDSAGGRWLRIRHAGKAQLELILGERGPDYQSAYLRRPGDTHVYLWRGRLASVADRAVEGWRDRRIAALAVDSIAALDVVRGKDRYTLARARSAWTLNGTRTDSAAVARYLDRVKVITAAGFATPAALDSAKGRAVRRLAVRGAHGVVLTLAFDSTPTVFLVHHVGGVGGDGATVYRMNFWDVDGVTPASRSLLPPKK